MPARAKGGQFRKDPLARERSLEALQLMRSERLSLTAAAGKVGTTPATVWKHVPRALKQDAEWSLRVHPLRPLHAAHPVSDSGRPSRSRGPGFTTG